MIAVLIAVALPVGRIDVTSADRFSVWGVVYASTSSTANPGTKRSGGRGGTAGLLVAVDQRTAALRDRLSDGRRGPALVGLAGYAGLHDAARNSGGDCRQATR